MSISSMLLPLQRNGILITLPFITKQVDRMNLSDFFLKILMGRIGVVVGAVACHVRGLGFKTR